MNYFDYNLKRQTGGITWPIIDRQRRDTDLLHKAAQVRQDSAIRRLTTEERATLDEIERNLTGGILRPVIGE